MPFELTFLHALQDIHNGVLDSIMVGITTLGNAGILWIVTAVALLFFKKTRKCGITMGVALILGLIFGNGILKNLIARDRPCWVDESIKSALLIANPKDYSWPSGHTLSSIECAIVIFYHKKVPGAIALVLACLIAFSRLYIGVHWPTDIIGGALLGCATSAAGILIVNLIYKKIAEKKADSPITVEAKEVEKPQS